MAVAGSLTYDTKIDKSGFEKGLNSLKNTTNTVGGQIKSIVSALGIDKIISKTFSIINSSIDGAISRLDTLNNYPKVMSNLGIASEDAQKSIDKMSDKLSGLPTTLDEGALAVQRFTSKNSDVNKSTNYFLALNNALLAGGAGADIQSTALEQLSQSYSKGKPDMMEWRSAMTAMPAQLKQVAQAMGYVNADKLGEDLRKGKVSMDSFMDTLVKLNDEGYKGFQSFEEQARNSTGGIATSIKVAKTQVVKGVTDIINSLDQVLKDEGLGGISVIISNVGKKAKEVLDLIAQKLPIVKDYIVQIVNNINQGLQNAGIGSFKDVLNSIKNVLMNLFSIVKNIIDFIIPKIPKIVEVLVKIAPLIGAILIGIKAYKTTIAIIQGVQKAFALLNAIMALNPIGLIVAGIAVLVAGFIYLWNTSEDFRNFWINLWESIKKIVSSAIEGIKKFFTGIIDFIKNNWKGLVLFLVNPFAGAFKLLYDNCEGFRNFINNFIENIKQFFINAWNGIVSFFTETIPQWIQNVIDWFSNLPYMIGYQIGQIIGSIIKFGMDVWNWITTELPKIIQSIIDWFAQLPGRIWDWLYNVIQNIKNWCIETYNTATEWISKTINSIVDWFSKLPRKNLELVTKYN